MGENKRVLLSGYYGFDNSGDDAILKAMVKELKKSNNNIKITALSYNPSLTERTYNINAINRFNIKEVLTAIKNCDLFISGGGSLLQDITSTRSLWYYITLMRLAKMFKKPVMVYANGVGPINGKINRIGTRNILNKVEYITLRDEGSKVFLDELGVVNKNICVTADPVFNLEATVDSQVEEILIKEKIPLDKPLVGIAIRKWTNDDKLIDSLSKAASHIISKYDANIVIIPMHYPEDLDISKDLLEKLNKERCFIIWEKYNVEDIMGIINRLEFIIAMRLHSLIYAATQHVPMIGIIYDPKIEGFLKSIEMNNMCTVEDIDSISLIEDIDFVWENREDLSNRLISFDSIMKDQALKNVNIAIELLKSGCSHE